MSAPVPHLNFRGSAREALEFYARAFRGRAAIRTYADFGMPAELPGAQGVVYGQVFASDGFTVMAYDVPGTSDDRSTLPGTTRRENGTTVTDQSFFLALVAPTLEDAERNWAALLDGAAIIEPLAASDWSAGFGMLTDRFGVTWSISVGEAEA
jgi:PhnB protein